MYRRKTIIPTAATAAVLVTALVITLTAGPGGGHLPPSSPAAGASCPPSQRSGVMPAAPPPDLTWRTIGVIPVPVSARYGPSRISGSVWLCYAHSPMGAVLAAYDIVAAIVSRQWRQAAQAGIAPGPGKRAFFAQSQGVSFRQPAPGQLAQPLGFAVVAYTPAQASVELLASDGNGGYQTDLRTVTWTGGDWKLLLTPDGRLGPGPQPAANAARFIVWGEGGA